MLVVEQLTRPGFLQLTTALYVIWKTVDKVGFGHRDRRKLVNHKLFLEGMTYFGRCGGPSIPVLDGIEATKLVVFGISRWLR